MDEKFCLLFVTNYKIVIYQDENNENHNNSLFGFFLITGCKKSEKEVQLEEFLQTHYPATKVKIINISELDSVYDPYNAVSGMLHSGNYRSEDKPDFGIILDDNRNPKNAIGRIAKVKVPFKSFEQNIKVIYDKNGNILHTSLQTDLMIEHIWDFWREWKRGDDHLPWRFY